MNGQHSSNGGSIAAPVRNRFFYGKLMDVRHFELEQSYFLEMRRLMNRLGHGVGVVSGLGVEPTDDGRLIVRPGLATDDRGREILVTSSVCIEHPLVPSHPCSDPEAEPVRDDWLTVYLCYHECDAEPAPVLVSDCDTREDCRPGIVRERFRIEIREGRPDPPAGLSAEQCAAVFPISPGEGFNRRAAACEALSEPFETGSDACVVLATVHAPQEGERLIVDECGFRTTVYSNSTLFDLMLCLAARVDRCCGPRPTTDFTTIRALWPPNAAELTNTGTTPGAEWFKRWLAAPSVEVTFADEVVPPDDDGDPAAWLRMWLFGRLEGQNGAVVRAFRIPLTFEGVTQNPVLGVAGHTLRYLFEQELGGDGSPIAGSHGVQPAISFALAELSDSDAANLRRELRVLVQIRSGDSGGQVVDGAGRLVDADFAGTGLSQAQLDDVWEIDASEEVDESLWDALADSGERLPESGDGDEGGGFHSMFSIVVGRPPVTSSFPVVLSHWPPNGAVFGDQDVPTERLWRSRSRIELIFDRDLDPALLDAPADWIGLWLVQQPDDNTATARRLPLSLGDPDDPLLVFQDEVPGARAVFDISPDVSVEPGRYVVLIRSEAGAITDTSQPPLELDADFAGSQLTDQQIAVIWKVEAQVQTVDAGIWTALQPTADRLAPVAPGEGPGQSGDGDEGGELHLTFEWTSL